MVCKDLCLKIRVPSNGRYSAYHEGKKFCRGCHCFFITERVYCECCGKCLRTKRHDKRSRQKIRYKQLRKKYNKQHYEKNKNNPVYIIKQRLNNQKYERENKAFRNIQKKTWKREHREQVKVYDHEYHMRNRELRNAKERSRYALQKALKEQLANTPQLLEIIS